VLSRNSDRLGSAYRVTSSTSSFAASGSGSGTWMASIATFAAGSPPPPPPILPVDDAPVARLSVSQAPSPPLTIVADASASTDTDATPIASYRFDFGDGTMVTTIAPATSATHTYATAGSYTISLTATDTGAHTSAAVTASITESLPVSVTDAVAVWAGYYDTHHAKGTNPKPSPWMGSSNVVFIGQPDPGTTNKWDTSCVRVDNLGTSSMPAVAVAVDIGSRHYALWGSVSIPAGNSLILAQTALENFDGSDTNPAGCYYCSPTDCMTRVTTTIPVVHVTVNGTRTDYYDIGQTLNTHGVDAAGCPYTGIRNDESQAWQRILSAAAMRAASSEASRAATSIGDRAQWLANPAPNPSHGGVDIHFRTAVRGVAVLEVFDIGGRLVSRSEDGLLEPGEHRERMNLAGAAPGIYFCTLQVAGVTLRDNFVLVR